MRLAHEEYPKLQAIWISNQRYHNSEALIQRFKVEDKLLEYTRSELEQLELYIWAHLMFGNKEVIKNTTIAKSIQTIISEILGNVPIVDEGFRVVPK